MFSGTGAGKGIGRVSGLPAPLGTPSIVQDNEDVGSWFIPLYALAVNVTGFVVVAGTAVSRSTIVPSPGVKMVTQMMGFGIFKHTADTKRAAVVGWPRPPGEVEPGA
jgi:hypothetical protein